MFALSFIEVITQSMINIGTCVVITDGYYTGSIGSVYKVPDAEDYIDMEKKWLAAGMGSWGDGYAVPDSYHVRLRNCSCGLKAECQHLITYLQIGDLKPVNE